jgi:hypothetical protein
MDGEMMSGRNRAAFIQVTVEYYILRIVRNRKWAFRTVGMRGTVGS